MDMSFSGGSKASLTIFPNLFFASSSPSPATGGTSHQPSLSDLLGSIASGGTAAPTSAQVRSRNQILNECGQLHYLPAERLLLLTRLRHAIGSDQGISLAQHMASVFALSSGVAVPLAYRLAPRLGVPGVAATCLLPVAAFVAAYVDCTYQQYQSFVDALASSIPTSSSSSSSSPSSFTDSSASASSPSFDPTIPPLRAATTLPSPHAAPLLYAAHSLLSAEQVANRRRAAGAEGGSLLDRVLTTADGSHLGEFPLTRHKRAMVEDALRRAGLPQPDDYS